MNKLEFLHLTTIEVYAQLTRFVFREQITVEHAAEIARIHADVLLEYNNDLFSKEDRSISELDEE